MVSTPIFSLAPLPSPDQRVLSYFRIACFIFAMSLLNVSKSLTQAKNQHNLCVTFQACQPAVQEYFGQVKAWYVCVVVPAIFDFITEEDQEKQNFCSLTFEVSTGQCLFSLEMSRNAGNFWEPGNIAYFIKLSFKGYCPNPTHFAPQNVTIS